jgi:hypothetical protein
MENADRAVTIANDRTLTKLIRGATRRVVFLAPAASKPVAEALAERWCALGPEAVSIILDVHPEVYRLGYGDPEALAILQKTARSLHADLDTQSGIRIGVVVADDTTLVYSPPPLLIEAGPKRYETPNAILLDAPPARVWGDLGLGRQEPQASGIGQDKASDRLIANVEADLQQNPPQSFNIARTVRVFNAYFEFVEFELQGAFLERRVVPIPPDLMGLARDEKTQRLLKASFRLVDDMAGLSGKPLQQTKSKLMNDYLTLLPGYGHVVLRTVKPNFERKVAQLRLAVTRFQRRIKANLQKAMDANRLSLCEALLPAVRGNPPKRWKKHYSGVPSDDLLRRLLEGDLFRSFGTAEGMIKEMKVNLLFKAVTYELLKDQAFMEIAKKKLPALSQLYDEYDAAGAKGLKP